MFCHYFASPFVSCTYRHSLQTLNTCVCINSAQLVGNQLREFFLSLFLCIVLATCHFLNISSRNLNLSDYFYILFKSIVSIPRIQLCKRLQPLVHFILSIQSYNLTSSSPDSNYLFQTSRLSESLQTWIILKPSFNTTNCIYNTRPDNHIPILYSNLLPTGLEPSKTIHISQHRNLRGEEWSGETGLILCHGKVYVPLNSKLQFDIVRAHHNSPVTGHPGHWRTTELVSRNYWWPGMGHYIAKYVKCVKCWELNSRGTGGTSRKDW